MAAVQPKGGQYASRQTSGGSGGGFAGMGIPDWLGGDVSGEVLNVAVPLGLGFLAGASVLGTGGATAGAAPAVAKVAAPSATKLMGAQAAMSGTQQATSAAIGMANPAEGPEYSPAVASNLQGLASAGPVQRARPLQQSSAMDPAMASQMREELLRYQKTDGLALGAGALRGFGGSPAKGTA
tara:strand:+ start:821 stop:1366 length:546 start_codon:yes stop_codon:yes gene_type:complete